MNGILNIQVRVAAQQAQQQLGALRATLSGLGQLSRGQVAGGLGSIGNAFTAAGDRMVKFGKNVQWTGRQLEYAFTLPIVAAGAIATKFALQNEAASTQLRKVYGLLEDSTHNVNAELKILGETFVDLSNRFGVHQAQVIGIAKTWAEAGMAGVGLQKSVRNTLEAMTIGSIDAERATQGLIAIQFALGLSSDQLRSALAQLDIIQVQSGIDFGGLLDVISRSASVAKIAGVDLQHLAAMAAAIVPAAGGAAQAGNALRTIITRLLTPSKDATDLFQVMGINMDKFMKLSGTARFEELVRKFQDLSDGQKAIVSTTVASRFQVNRFAALMNDAAKASGYYQKSLATTQDKTKTMQLYQHQLNTVLESSPQRLKILGTILENNLSKIIIPLLPVLLALMARLVHLVAWFGRLSPATQQWVLALLAALAVFGPLLRYLGAFGSLGGTILKMLGWLAVRSAMVVAWLGKMIIAHHAKALESAADSAIEAAAATMAAAEEMAAESALANLAALAAEERAAAHAMAAASAQGEAAAVVAASAEYIAAVEAEVLAQAVAAAEIAAAEAAKATAAWEAAAAMVAAAETSAAAQAQAAWEAAVAVEAADATVVAGAWEAAMASAAAWEAAAAVEAEAAWAAAFATEEAAGGLLAAVGRAIMTVGELIVGAVVEVVALPEELVVAIVAVIAILGLLAYKFRKQIVDAIETIIRAFWRLPEVIASVFKSVIRIISSAIKAAVEWLSHLNPFARHSPSLVENVQKGTAVVGGHYDNMASSLSDAHTAHANFMNATAGARGSLQTAAYAKQKADIVAVAPQAGPQVDALIASLKKLHPLLDTIQADMDAQQKVVDLWKLKLDAANRTLKDAQDQLDILKARSDAAKEALDAAKDVLSRLADTPLQGMKAMNDAIFNNEMAQKQLRLEFLKMEDVNGTFDDLQKRMASLQGEIETLRGQQHDLRAAGAGSDILGPIDDQIKSLQQAQNHIQDTSEDFKDLQERLDKLQHAGEELDLTKSLQFDPLKKQIDDVVNSMNEVPFDQLYQQIVAQQQTVGDLTTAWQTADAATQAQQAVVDDLTAKRDVLQRSYDLESDKLQMIRDDYTAVNDQIQKMEGALNDLSAAAAASVNDMSRIQQEFNQAAGGFGTGVQGPAFDEAGTLADMKKFEEDAKKAAEEAAAKIGEGFGKIDLFKPIKEMWHKAWKWMGAKVAPAWQGIQTVVGAGVGWLERNLSLEGLKNIWGAAWGAISDAASAVWTTVLQPIWQAIVDFINNNIMPVLQTLGDFFAAIWGGIQMVLAAAWSFIQPIWQALVDFINNYIVPILQMMGAIFDITWALIGKVIGAAWALISMIFGFFMNGLNLLGTAVQWLWNSVISPVFNFIGNLISWVWTNLIQPALQAIWSFINDVLAPVFMWLWNSVISPAFNAIGSIISGAWNDVIQPALHGIWDFITNTLAPIFDWLWHKVIEPALNGIAGIFSSIWDGIMSGIKGFANFFIDVFNTIAQLIMDVGGAVGVTVKIKKMPHIGESTGGKAPAGGYGGVHGLARGGRIDQATLAMIGEGIGPEYVIPTDPRYRANAMKMWMQLGHELGIPGYKGGGILSTIGDAAKSVGGTVGDIIGGVKAGVAAPFFKAMDVIISHIPSKFFRDLATGMKNEVYNFIVGKHAKAAFAGAYVKGSAQGSLLRVGDRFQDEKVVPLSRAPKEGARELHFHGDLSFPNIKSGDDAEKFIRNLETLVPTR